MTRASRRRALAGPWGLVDRLALPAILGLALALRLFRLGSDSLWYDEGWSVMVAHMDILSMPSFIVQNDTHPPLYYALLHAWVVIFGDSEAAVRSLSVVFSVLLVLVMYLIGRTLAGRAVGLAAALFAALSRFFVQYAQETRNYSLLGLLTGVSFLLLLRLLERPSRRRAALYVIATTLLLYTHVYGLFVVLAEALFVLVRVRAAAPPGPARRSELGRWARIGAALLVLYLPWLAILSVQTSEEISGSSRANLTWLHSPSALDLVGTLEAYIGSWVGLGVVSLVALGIALLARTRGAELKTFVGEPATIGLALLLLLPIAVPAALSYASVPIYLKRYTFPAAVAFYLLMAVLSQRLAPPRYRPIVVTTLALVLASGTVWYHRTIDKDDWRGVARYVEQRAQAHDLVLFDLSWQQTVYDYYRKRADLEERSAARGLLLQRDGTSVPAGRVWLIVSAPGKAKSVIPAELGQAYERRLDRHFTGIDVQFFERPA